MDLVVTCPKSFWYDWIAEGDPAGSAWSGEEWGWYLTLKCRPPITVGDRLYVVAHDRLRGYAPVTGLKGLSFDPKHGATGATGVYMDAAALEKDPPREKVEQWCICRRGGAVAVTIAERIKGFQGFRYRWWKTEDEVSFPNWRVVA